MPTPRWFVLGLLALGACAREHPTATSSSAAVAEAPKPGVQLRGSFRQVARKVVGTAEITMNDGRYELVLRNVRVEANDPVHVYLVGLAEAKTSRDIAQTETKYDFGELEQGATEQRIALPSKPAPEIRSVVLFNPLYGVNLAWAPLR